MDSDEKKPNEDKPRTFPAGVTIDGVFYKAEPVPDCDRPKRTPTDPLGRGKGYLGDSGPARLKKIKAEAGSEKKIKEIEPCSNQVTASHTAPIYTCGEKRHYVYNYGQVCTKCGKEFEYRPTAPRDSTPLTDAERKRREEIYVAPVKREDSILGRLGCLSVLMLLILLTAALNS